MLSRSQIEEIAQTITNGNAGHAEKLYLQDIILATISRETVDQIVFKGGTALLKCYQLDRFSEDLDFTARKTLDWPPLVKLVVRDLENYGAGVPEQTVDESNQTYSTRFGIQGPLFTGNRRSLCFVRIEVNKRSTVSRLLIRRYNPRFPDIPSFDLAVLDEAEIIAEKIMGLMTRHQPRDLYDIYHLLLKSVPVEPDLVQEKLDYYDLTYNPDEVIANAKNLQGAWTSIEPLVYSTLPPFTEVIAILEKNLT